MQNARPPIFIFHLAFFILNFELLAGVAAQELAAPPGSARGPDGQREVNLDIPDTGQDQKVPRGGWCGEAAIQMAGFQYGAYIPQKTINQAGNPRHPDLYAGELGRALTGVGLAYEPWDQRDVKDDVLAAFLRWVRTHLAGGHPVLVGAKINPTQHPEWALDHFMLAVGAKAQSFVFNTTWKKQEEITLEQLSSMNKGLSFENTHKLYFALAVTGRKPNRGLPVRLAIKREKDDAPVTCTVSVSGLEKGQRYVLVTTSDLGGFEKAAANTVATEKFTAESEKKTIVKTVPADKPALFYCLRESELK